MEIGTLVLFLMLGATLIGLFAGFLISYIFLVPRTSGTLHVDQTDPVNMKYLFEVDNLDQIGGKSKVTLKVNGNAHLSQE